LHIVLWEIFWKGTQSWKGTSAIVRWNLDSARSDSSKFHSMVCFHVLKNNVFGYSLRRHQPLG
jgi:hypothetical protein